MTLQRPISPVDRSVYVEREQADAADIEAALARAVATQRAWRETAVAERARFCLRMVEATVARRDALSKELPWQIGRPIAVAGAPRPGSTPATIRSPRRKARILFPSG